LAAVLLSGGGDLAAGFLAAGVAAAAGLPLPYWVSTTLTAAERATPVGAGSLQPKSPNSAEQHSS
jgi:hypothetical protein